MRRNSFFIVGPVCRGKAWKSSRSQGALKTNRNWTRVGLTAACGSRLAHRRDAVKLHGILPAMSDGGKLDLEFMAVAIDEARGAALAEEVPIGAAVVVDGRVIARAGNRTLRDGDPTAHAEMVTLRAAAQEIGNHRLLGATMFVTLEPCAMCAGAMIQARIARLVYGADDPKGGAVRSCFEVLRHPRLNHQVEVTAGVQAEEAATLLRDFFAVRRGAKT